MARHDAARKALTAAGPGSAVAVSVTAIDAPREPRLAPAADPQETADYAALPLRIRNALKELPDAAHQPSAEGAIDALLLHGEPVRLIRLKPLT